MDTAGDFSTFGCEPEVEEDANHVIVKCYPPVAFSGGV
jgi:hypothetical protein